MTELLDPADPPEAGEGQSLRAAELKNRPVILQPTGVGEAEGKDGKPWRWVSCNVWVLDRQGIEQEATDCRISWWRAKAQIEHAIGRFVACRPVEQPDNSIVLVPLRDDARKVAEQVVADLEAAAPAPTAAEPPPVDDGSEPF